MRDAGCGETQKPRGGGLHVTCFLGELGLKQTQMTQASQCFGLKLARRACVAQSEWGGGGEFSDSATCAGPEKHILLKHKKSTSSLL